MLLTAVLGFFAWERLTFDRAAWIADYEQLRGHVSAVYANLLWTIRERGIDPAALDRDTRERLNAAATDRQARAAIAAFVNAFADGHFQVRRVKLSKRLSAWWASRGSDTTALDPTTDGEAACDALGFQQQDGELRFGLAAAPGFTALTEPGAAFPAAMLELEERRIGVLRIPAFDQHSYRSACVRAWARKRAALVGPCDDACRDEFVDIEVPNQLLAELAAQARSLTLAGIQLLVIDITRNGGGTDWVDPAARILSAATLDCPRLAFIKHRHWSERLRALLGEVEEDLRAEWSAPERDTLIEAKTRLVRWIAQSEETCDLSPIWGGVPAACSNLVEDGYHACGVFSSLPPGHLAGARSRTGLFHGLEYAYEPGAYEGKLAVLIDGSTASAAEHFAAMLADSGAAVLLGERTHGSGCGYTGGGLPAILDHSELRVDMPDCQRRRSDGSNELAGVTPELLVDLSEEGGEAARRERLLAALLRLTPVIP